MLSLLSTLECEEFEKSEKVGCAAVDLYQTMITTRAPDGANNVSCPEISIQDLFPKSLSKTESAAINC